MIKRTEYLEQLKKFKDVNIIKVITGIRRCGKSTLFELYKSYLLENGVSEDQIISMNFEDPEYLELNDWKVLYDNINSRLLEDKMNYIFLDEIQNIKEFERAVDGLFIKKNVDLYITGSNAYMLSSDLATLLTGRYIEIKMLPLSFKEYLSAFDDEKDIQKKFLNFLRYSSFPQALEFFKIDPDTVDTYLEGIFNTILYKDIIVRNDITDKSMLDSITRYLFDSIGSPISIKKISDTLTSMSKPTNSHTVGKYVNALLDSFMLYKVNRYDIKGKELLSTQEKYYLVDLGIRYHLLGKKAGTDMGHILENVVFLELLRRGYKVYVGKTDNLEVDFIAQNKEETIYYQVALTTREENVLERELKPLKAIRDSYPKYILTMDYDLDADYDGIKKINVIDWLLK